MGRALLLLAIMVGALTFAYGTWTSVTTYESPYHVRGGLPGSEPVAERAVLIVLDGIRLDVSRGMRELQALAGRGSSGTSRSVLPSLSNPNWAVFMTGAWPEVNGVTNNGRFRPPPVDSLFSLAADADLPRAAAGSTFWGRAFGDYLEGNLLFQQKDFPHGYGAAAISAWQADLCGGIERFFSDRSSGLLVAGITGADGAAHDDGGESQAYRKVVQAVDRCLGSLVKTLDDGRTAFVIVSDHGHIDRRGGGGHGGAEPEVMEVPLVLFGKGVRQAQGWQAQMVDIAPTLSVLLGLPLPATNQGGILWHSLDLPDEQSKSAQERFEQQQERLGEIVGVGGPRNDSLSPRVISSLTVIALALGVIGWAFLRSPERLMLLVGAAAYFLFYRLLFMVLGLGYSLSVINSEELLYRFLGKDVLAAVVGLLAVTVPWRLLRPTFDSGKAFALAGVIISVIAIEVAWIHWASGLFMEDVLPDFDLNLKAALHLIQLGAVSLTAAVTIVWLPDADVGRDDR
jgi:hypothetical protein